MIRSRPFARLRRRLSAVMSLVVAAVGLAGCGTTVQDAFGLSKRSPDEFAVVRRAPLVVPPEYRLRPPGAGTATAATSTASADAYTALTGQAQPVDPNMSAGEQALMARLPEAALPNIRDALAEEGTQVATLDRGSYLFLFSWQRAQDIPVGEVVDPIAESQRLRTNGLVSTRRMQSVPLTP